MTFLRLFWEITRTYIFSDLATQTLGCCECIWPDSDAWVFTLSTDLPHLGQGGGGTYLFVCKVLYTYIQYLLQSGSHILMNAHIFWSAFSGKETKLFSWRLHCVGHYWKLRYWTDTAGRQIPWKEFLKFLSTFTSVSAKRKIRYGKRSSVNFVSSLHQIESYTAYRRVSCRPFWEITRIVYIVYTLCNQHSRLQGARHSNFLSEKIRKGKDTDMCSVYYFLTLRLIV